MKANMSSKRIVCEIIAVLAGILLFGIGIVFRNSHHLPVSALFVLSAVILYFFIVYCVDEGNVLSIKALFSAVWLGTIGLSNAKLLEYQKVWEVETWLTLGLAFVAIHLGVCIGSYLYQKKASSLPSFPIAIGKRIKLFFDPSRLFTICWITTLIGVLCFVINVAIKGYIPFFVKDDYAAYFSFYTRFYIFIVASSAVSGLCYYTLKTQTLSKWKKALLYICIAMLVFIMPMLLVSRGNQMIAMLSFSVAVVLLNEKRKLPIFILCMIVSFSFYEIGSRARNLSNEFLEYVFQPKSIVLSIPSATDSSPEDEPELDEDAISEGEDAPDEYAVSEGDEASANHEYATFKLPPSVSFLYGYLTVSHDNLNEAVLYNDHLTYGLRQLEPLLPILRFPALQQKIDSLDFYQVNISLNTADLIADAYYDFGCIGSAVFMLLWAIVFGIIEQHCIIRRGPFAMLVYGNLMTPIVLCFFESWLSYFTFWLLFGTIFLLFLCDILHSAKNRRIRT